MHVILRETHFDALEILQSYQREHLDNRYDLGAQSVFIGTMRDVNEGAAVSAMFLEHYPGMTERCLLQLTQQALVRSGADDALVVHRVGPVLPGEPIVLVGVWSAHRAAALAACQEIIEQLKHTAPFWKREHTPEGARWVETNTPGILTHD